MVHHRRRIFDLDLGQIRDAGFELRDLGLVREEILRDVLAVVLGWELGGFDIGVHGLDYGAELMQ